MRTKAESLRRPRTPVRAAATTTLSPQSVALVRATLSPVRAISKSHHREPTQRVRNTCAGNRYVPRVSDDRVAYHQKRRPFLDGVHPDQSDPETPPWRANATLAQHVRQKLLRTKGFDQSRCTEANAWVWRSPWRCTRLSIPALRARRGRSVRICDAGIGFPRSARVDADGPTPVPLAMQHRDRPGTQIDVLGS